MSSEDFIKFCKDSIGTDNLLLVWYSKTLANKKCILSQLNPSILYECTYNGNSDEVYIDKYAKVSNTKVEVKE